MLLEGLHIPLTTPFAADGSVALPKLAANVARYSKTPAAGLIVLGPSGEPSLLSDDETRDVLRTAAEAAAPEKVLLAGIARDSVRSVLALADLAAQLHYDAILIGRPPGLQLASTCAFRTGKDPEVIVKRLREQLVFFQTIADRAPLPLVLVSTSDRPLASEVLVELAGHRNIIGLIDCIEPEKEMYRIPKGIPEITREVAVTHVFTAVTERMKIAAESTTAPALISAASLTTPTATIAEPSAIAAALRTRTRSVAFQVLIGSGRILFDALSKGAVGIAPSLAAAAPHSCYEVFAAFKDGDVKLAREKHFGIRMVASFERFGPAYIKYACDLNGYAGGLPRLPNLPLNGDQRFMVELSMKRTHN